jgi:hypothetical protein
MTWSHRRHDAASEAGGRRRHQTGYVPKAEGGFAPDFFLFVSGCKFERYQISILAAAVLLF